MNAAIGGIEYHLPEGRLLNTQLAAQFPEWSAEKIEEKTGIVERRIAAPDECSSDLGTAAARKLFASGVCLPGDIDYLLFCTQSPDYFLPTSACLMQERLGIPTTAGALDFNLGCSGYVYGLGLAKALVETGQARNVLLVTAETYSKFIHAQDKNVRTIFGDAGAATLIRGTRDSRESIGPFAYGTDGSGARNLMVAGGAMRERAGSEGQVELYMNGPEIFAFTLDVVPRVVRDVLARAGKSLDEIDLFVFHQANRYLLDHLRKKLKIPADRFFICLRESGNTVSATIPIALREAEREGRMRPGDLILLAGFGVGYSWGATLVRWQSRKSSQWPN
jgi:3-oxoacyl-[acyl-carrier-protein] synthase-3